MPVLSARATIASAIDVAKTGLPKFKSIAPEYAGGVPPAFQIQVQASLVEPPNTVFPIRMDDVAMPSLNAAPLASGFNEALPFKVVIKRAKAEVALEAGGGVVPSAAGGVVATLQALAVSGVRVWVILGSVPPT